MGEDTDDGDEGEQDGADNSRRQHHEKDSRHGPLQEDHVSGAYQPDGGERSRLRRSVVIEAYHCRAPWGGIRVAGWRTFRPRAR
jgi:hypothetical protein